MANILIRWRCVEERSRYFSCVKPAWLQWNSTPSIRVILLMQKYQIASRGPFQGEIKAAVIENNRLCVIRRNGAFITRCCFPLLLWVCSGLSELLHFRQWQIHKQVSVHPCHGKQSSSSYLLWNQFIRSWQASRSRRGKSQTERHSLNQFRTMRLHTGTVTALSHSKTDTYLH